MSPAAPAGAVDYPPAELDRRFYAFAIDRILAWGIMAGSGYLAWRLLIDDGSTVAGVAVIVAVVLVVSLVFGLLLGVAGMSPGKAMVGLRVVRPADGRPIGAGAGMVRTLVLGIFTLPTFGLGVATLAWTAVMDPGGWRRGAHDRMSDAVVVDVRPVPVATAPAEVEAPRQIVNLTAMRLMPAPPPAAAQAETIAPAPPPPVAARPSLPPPAPPPAPPASPPASPPSSAPVTVPVPAPVTPAPASVPSVGPAPVTWRVRFDTGEALVVEGLALVGRGPEPRPGEAAHHLLPLRSTDMSLSKTHAQFQVASDGALVVMDRGSTNGSFVVRGGVSKALSAGRPTTLLPGDQVRFGDRTMTVERD